jgi:hypothetical protein
MLVTEKHRLPNETAWTMEITIAGSMLTGVIDMGRGPLLRVWVVLDGRDLARLVPSPRILDLPTPVAVVEMLKELEYDPVVGSLSSLVKALAWAWVCPM